ncbi:MAG TPA: transaldolase [Rhodanobacteraceae bacterium]|jgi:transaldolase|nr:transaldolase [Rhodanobacteraceae bacterium]
MNATQQLHDLGQSIWLDNITRGILNDGTLARYIAEDNVTGLTSNPSIFDKAISGGSDYDSAVAELLAQGQKGEELFFSLALQDLTRAADLFKPAHHHSDGVDGFVSLEVSPLLADDTHATIESAVALHAKARRDNLFIKIPGTPAGIPAIEEAIYRGVPINVTLLFSREQTLAAAEAWMRGIERRIAEGKAPNVDSVVSLFVSRWDVAVAGKVPAELDNRLGIAIAQRTWKAWCELLETPRWKKIVAAGVHPQRLLWASTGTKDPKAPDTLYVEALAAPGTINTIPDKTLLAFADHGRLHGSMPNDGGDCEQVIAQFNAAGIDDAALAGQLQREGAEKFVKSWHDLLGRIAQKSASVEAAGQGAQA